MTGRNRQVSGTITNEGKGEVPLRYICEHASWFKEHNLRILTDPIDVRRANLIHPRTGEPIRYLQPDFALVFPNDYQLLIFDDGGVHSKPTHIDDDLLKTAALSTLGFKVIRLQHKNNLTPLKLKIAQERLSQIVAWYVESHWIDLDWEVRKK